VLNKKCTNIPVSVKIKEKNTKDISKQSFQNNISDVAKFSIVFVVEKKKYAYMHSDIIHLRFSECA
jgi:hypothetical protein